MWSSGSHTKPAKDPQGFISNEVENNPCFLKVSNDHSHSPQDSLVGYSSDSLSFIPFCPSFSSRPKVLTGAPHLQSHPPPDLLGSKSVSLMNLPLLKPSMALIPLINRSKCFARHSRPSVIWLQLPCSVPGVLSSWEFPRTWNLQACLKRPSLCSGHLPGAPSKAYLTPLPWIPAYPPCHNNSTYKTSSTTTVIMDDACIYWVLINYVPVTF